MYWRMGVVFALSLFVNAALHRMIAKGAIALKDIQIEYCFFLPMALVLSLCAVIFIFMILWPKKINEEEILEKNENLVSRVGTIIIPVIAQLLAPIFAWVSGYLLSSQI